MEPVTPDGVPSAAAGLPLAGLLALAMAGFITILTEALPAGLLTQMSRDLAVSESVVGQLVTIYAIGSLLAAIPLVAATRSWRRRPLLQTAIGGFFIVNTVTALSDSYLLTLVARLFAGVFAGLLWALLAGFASRMAAPSLRGRAIAVAMVGTPLALSLGIPLGTLLGSWIGWRFTF
ncbi:MFS transporter, partial [Collimonas silvisoli]|uniref:MFS transporter n=1 Tax=Collimonas silvisoli TaxID=2825884 RepID=UPI001B8D6826